MLSLKTLAAKYPDFEVGFRMVRGQRSIVHKPTGYRAACILRSLRCVEDVICRFEQHRHYIGYWCPSPVPVNS